MAGKAVPKAVPKADIACDATIEKIDLVLNRLVCLEAVVTNQNAEQKPVVEETLRLVLASMRDLDSSAASLSDVDVPAKLLQWLDEGKDPDAFFKMLFDDTIWASQVMKGKLDAIASGRQGLETELQAAPARKSAADS